MKKFISLFLSFCIIFNFTSISTFAIESTNSDYFFSGNTVIWAKSIGDYLYSATVFEDGFVHLSKSYATEGDTYVLSSTEFKFETSKIKYSEAYWDELVMYTENSNFLWEVESFNNNSTYVLQRSVVSDIIAQQLRDIHGYDYNSHLLKTDTVSYPGYTFKVGENQATGSVVQGEMGFSAGKYISDIANELA